MKPPPSPWLVGFSSTTSLQSQKCGSTSTRSRCRPAATAVRWFLSSRRGLVKAYEECAWRREDMALLEFCRKTNKDGQIAKWVVQLHKASSNWAPADEAGTRLRKLHAFANECPMKGEKLVACDTLSLFNDRWFGQSLALRQPFRKLSDLLLNDVVEKVPSQYVHFANAALQRPDYWEDEERIRADLELEAVGKDKIQTFMAKVKAQRSLVERFLRGILTKEDEAGTTEALREVGLLPNEEDPLFRDVRFNQRQERLEQGICMQVARCGKGRQGCRQ